MYIPLIFHLCRSIHQFRFVGCSWVWLRPRGHSSMLLGAAKLLKDMDLPGTVPFPRRETMAETMADLWSTWSTGRFYNELVNGRLTISLSSILGGFLNLWSVGWMANEMGLCMFMYVSLLKLPNICGIQHFQTDPNDRNTNTRPPSAGKLG